MIDALNGFGGIIKVGGQTITNLRFADDIDLLAGSKSKSADLTKRLDSTAKKYGMEIGGDKSNIMVTSKRRDANRDPRQIQIDGCILEEVKSFQYLSSTVTEDVTSETEVKKRLATGHLAKLNKLWNTSNIFTPTKTEINQATGHLYCTMRLRNLDSQ